MAHLKIYKNNEYISTLILEMGQSYVAGRNADCEIVLDSEPGVSRQHFRILCMEGDWQVSVLSRYGEVYVQGEKTTDFSLQDQSEFEVPPYKFIFEKELTQTGPGEEISLSDRTMVMSTNSAQLKFIDPSTGTAKVFAIQWDSTIVGRDASCSIQIDQAKFSRKHFEIKKYEESYFIRDMGSSNGTIVNGKQIPMEDWTFLNSGDTILVADWKISFELVDVDFEKKLQDIAPALRAPVIIETPAIERPQPPPPQPRRAAPRPKPTNWVRLLSLGLLAFGIFYYNYEQEQKKQATPVEVAKSLSPFDRLNPDQQNYVRQTYNVGRQLFMQGKYELSRQEMIRLHQVIPQYEDSKQIEEMASQALITLAEQKNIEVKEKEKQELEEKIQKQVNLCRSKVNPKIESSEMESCLAIVIQFNPDHPMITTLRAEVDRIVTERRVRESQRSDYLERVRKHTLIYEQAQKIQKSGDDLLTIQAYEKVLASNYPDPRNLKLQARRQIASIQQSISDKQASLDQKAESARKSGKYKEAIVALQQALKINPENEVIKGRIESIMNELKKQMQVLYQEGILEESVGEVDSAKTKWKKIIEQSVPEEEYYKKSKIKLKKYGAA